MFTITTMTMIIVTINKWCCFSIGFAYRRPDRHPVPDSDDTGTQRPVSSTRNRHPVLDDGIGLKWGPGTVLDGSGTDPVPDNGVGIGIGRYRYRITVSVSVFNLPDFLLKNAGRTPKKFNLLKNAGRTASDVRNCRLRNAGRTPDVRIAECRKRRNVGRTPRREESGRMPRREEIGRTPRREEIGRKIGEKSHISGLRVFI